ncbi:TPA: hypothetical protein UM674_000215 [Stenotrophomonas maltophilia]|nr:hypothetical protein [Stenotrophomonas maltophilia]
MKLKRNGFAISTVLCASFLAVPPTYGLNIGKVLKSAGKSVGKAAGDIVRETGNAAGNIVRETGNAGHNAVKETGKATENVGAAAGKVGTDAAREIGRGGENVGQTLGRAGSDTAKEIGRGGENVAELGVAVGNYLVRTVDDAVDQVSDAEQRIREGKFVDAFWHLGVDPLTDQERRAAKMAQESSLANTVGAVAASVYGGPGGAAAYSAWYTYRQTGDVDLALKAGFISGATSASMSAVSGMPVDKTTMAQDVAKKAIMAGAVGGLAVAAAGGDGDALREGFLRSGGMVLIQDGYREFTKGDNTDPSVKGQDLVRNTKAAEFPAFCTLSLPGAQGSECTAPPRDWFRTNPDGSLSKVNGKPVLDMAKVDSRYSFVGKAAEVGQGGNLLAYESGTLMNGVAKIPGMNAMAIFHDQWVIQAPLEGWTNGATIIPAVVLTYMGTEAGIQNLVQKSVVSNEPSSGPAPAEGGGPAALAATTAGGGPLNSFLCMKGPAVTQAPSQGPVLSRSIFVTKGVPPSELACAVVYQKDQETREDTAPWFAVNDATYCEPKAEKLAAQHVADGWKCLAR